MPPAMGGPDRLAHPKKAALEQEPGRGIDDRRNIAWSPAFGRLVALRLTLLRAVPRLRIMIALVAGGTLGLFGSHGRGRQPRQKNRAEDQFPLHATHVTTPPLNGK